MNRDELKIKTYMRIAREIAKLSYCTRRQVGAIIFKDNQIIAEGYNGTPSGHENVCEINNKTQWYVLHAEANAILKLASSTQSSDGATLFTTASPCKECSKLIIQAKIKKVYYAEDYSDTTGIDFLKQNGIKIQQIKEL